jgi:hypothetical protein
MRGLARDAGGGGFVVVDFGTPTVVRRVSADGTLSTLAGVNRPFAGNTNGGAGTSSRLSRPYAVLPESPESVLILDK